MFTGDNVLGVGTSFLRDLGEYLDSLERMHAVVVREGLTTLHPAHGPTVSDARGRLAEYLAHRRQRLAEVRAVLEGAPANGLTSEEIAGKLYAGVPSVLLHAAAGNTLQALLKLERDGIAKRHAAAGGGAAWTAGAAVRWVLQPLEAMRQRSPEGGQRGRMAPGASGALWEVVGGAERGGILVRAGRDTASAAEAERLATGALVRELELEGERLRFQRLAGAGPAAGWVSTRLVGPPAKELLARVTGAWEVIGGGDKGGILVRTGKDTTSEAHAERLATGSLVQELALEGERLQYRLLAGAGPTSGWVSTRVSGKELLARADQVPASSSASPPGALTVAPATTRKLRVLAMCGSLTCRDMIKVQTGHLVAALGKDAAEWTFAEGSVVHPWELTSGVLSDFERKIAEKHGRITSWYEDVYHCDKDRPTILKQFDPAVRVESLEVPRRVRELRELMEAQGPFDAVVAFSQGCIMMHYLIGHLRQETEVMPWKVTVFFEGMHIRDEAYFDLFSSKSPHPTVHVFGRSSDYYHYAREGWCSNRRAEDYYENPLVLEHDEGHCLPTQQPRAKEIYRAVAEELLRRAGGGAS